MSIPIVNCNSRLVKLKSPHQVPYSNTQHHTFLNFSGDFLFQSKGGQPKLKYKKKNVALDRARRDLSIDASLGVCLRSPRCREKQLRGCVVFTVVCTLNQ